VLAIPPPIRAGPRGQKMLQDPILVEISPAVRIASGLWLVDMSLNSDSSRSMRPDTDLRYSAIPAVVTWAL